MSEPRTMLVDKEKVAEALASLPRPGALDEAIVMTVAEWYADGRLVLAGRAVQDDGLPTAMDRGFLETACVEVVGPWFDESHEAGRFSPMELAQRILLRYDRLRALPPLHDPQETASDG